MCFSPQRRAILQHPTFEKCSEDYSFLTFSLPNVLFATAACIFSTSELQKVLRNWRALYIFTSQCAFHHIGVQFFDIWTELQKVLRDRQFLSIFTSKCAFRHSGVQFFDIWTSKSAPKLTCFVHFDFTMCFSPQRRAFLAFFSEHLPPHPPL